MLLADLKPNNIDDAIRVAKTAIANGRWTSELAQQLLIMQPGNQKELLARLGKLFKTNGGDRSETKVREDTI